MLELPFAQSVSLEISGFSYLLFFFSWFYIIESLTCFSSVDHHLYLRAVFDAVSSSIDVILPMNPTADVFVLGNFNIHHNNWSTFSVKTDTSGNFPIPNYLTQLVGFHSRMADCESQFLLFWVYYVLLSLVFIPQWLSEFSSIWKSLSCCCSCFHWVPLKLKSGSICIVQLFLCWLGQS